MSIETQVGATSYGNARNAPATDEKSLGELFSDLTRESADLVRQEVNLAKAELTQKAAKMGKDAAMIAVGAFLAYAGALVLFASVVLILVEIVHLPAWGAALLVALIAMGGGAALAMNGVNALKKIDPMPHNTLDTLKEDAKWAKQQI